MLQIALKVSPDVVDIIVFCCLFVVCTYIYMFGWLLCRATYCSVVLRSIYFDAWCITCYPKQENSRSLHRVITYTGTSYLLYLLRCFVYHMLLRYKYSISAMFAGINSGVRFHTAVVFLIQ